MEQKEFRKFLLEQISLPREKWDKQFRDYAERKWSEKAVVREVPEFFEYEKRGKDLKRYLAGLDLTEEELKGKKILDLGCGDGNFIKECLDKKITEDVFGFDYRIKKEAVPSNYRGHLLYADFEKGPFPTRDFDLIISFAAVEAPSFSGEKKFPKKTLIFSLEALKEIGEIRIFPIRKSHPQSGLLGIEYSRRVWAEILKELESAKGIKWTITPIDIKSSGRNKDVWLEELLVIRKK